MSDNKVTISQQQQKYLEEVERLKTVTIEIASDYYHKNNKNSKYRVLNITDDNVKLWSFSSNMEITKTLHWTKKNLVRET